MRFGSRRLLDMKLGRRWKGDGESRKSRKLELELFRGVTGGVRVKYGGHLGDRY